LKWAVNLFTLNFATLKQGMTKYILLFFMTALLSCNDNINTTNTGNSQMPEEEKKLRDEISKDPSSAQVRNKLVDYFVENGDYTNAIKESDQLITIDSNNADSWDANARLNFLNRDTVRAKRAFEKAIKISPDPQFIISLATLYAQTKDPEALNLADLLLKDPKGRTALQGLFIKGLYYNYSGDKIKAIQFFDECLDNSYTFLDAYREKAIALYDIGKYADALKVLEIEVALAKNNEEAYYWMGKCLEKLGNKQQAIDNYKLALQIDNNYAEAKDALGKLGIVQ
jgi:tetratricopeptide (TPR) repeat protein